MIKSSPSTPSSSSNSSQPNNSAAKNSIPKFSMSMMLDSTEMDKLSYEIFSILEKKFLFGGYDSSSFKYTPNKNPKKSVESIGKIRILSIDASDGDLLAAIALSHLESNLQSHSGDPNARIADFFDVVAGSSSGGVLAAMLFCRGPDERPLYSANEALHFLVNNRQTTASKLQNCGIFRRIFHRPDGIFHRMFGELTLRDTLKPVLIPCYDLSTGASFLFSRADAMETDAYNFKMSRVCAGTCAERMLDIRSIDQKTIIAAVGGGVMMANPTMVAITHVLNNKHEFPFANGVEDLLVISLGGGHVDSISFNGKSTPSRAGMLRIVGNGIADTVDQAVAMAFGDASSYVRIQANAFHASPKSRKSRKSRDPISRAEEVLAHRNVEAILFQGKKISQLSNIEKLEKFRGEIIKEQVRRKSSPIPTVVVKHQALMMTPPRSSSATTCSTSTTAVTSSSMDSC